MKNKQIKICAICGDKAIAKNFGALTCKSCKPFFRRNAIKNKVFKCKNGDKCQITKITRKRCRKCRLDKCFAVGMRKDLILSDVEKHFRRSIVEENRKKKKVRESSQTNQIVDLFCESSLSKNSFETTDCFDEKQIIDQNEKIIEMTSDYGNCLEVYESDTSVNNELNQDQISEIEGFLAITDVIRKSSDPYKSTIDLVSKGLTIARPVNHYDIKYTELEEYKQMELLQIFKPLVNSWIKNYKIIKMDSVVDVPSANNCFYEREISNLIESLQKFNVFDDICENDRIALVKYSCVDIICLRSIQLYDLKAESWVIPMDEERAVLFKLDILKSLKNELYIIYKNFLDYIIRECHSDTVILDLLTAIALFNPNRPNLINTEFVRVQQHIYLYLLQRYITFKYRTKSEAEFKLVDILKTLVNAHILGKLEKKYFFDDYQEQYSPIVKEVLDV